MNNKKFEYQSVKVHDVQTKPAGNTVTTTVTIIDESKPEYPDYMPFEFYGDEAQAKVQNVKAGSIVSISGFLGGRWWKGNGQGGRAFLSLKGTFCRVDNGLPQGSPSFDALNPKTPTPDEWKKLTEDQRSEALNNLYQHKVSKKGADPVSVKGYLSALKQNLDATLFDDMPF